MLVVIIHLRYALSQTSVLDLSYIKVALEKNLEFFALALSTAHLQRQRKNFFNYVVDIVMKNRLPKIAIAWLFYKDNQKLVDLIKLL